MIKISRPEAYSLLDETDLKVIDHELQSIFNSDQRNGKDMDYQYFLEDEETVTLEVYWNGTTVDTFRFKRKQ